MLNNQFSIKAFYSEVISFPNSYQAVITIEY